MKKAAIKTIWIFTLISLAVISIFGLTISILFQGDGMSGCPFMKGNSALCPADLVEHMSFWKGILLALPILAGMAAVYLVIAFQKLFHFDIRNHSPSYALRRYSKDSGLPPHFHYLLFFLSQGIIHPKLFS